MSRRPRYAKAIIASTEGGIVGSAAPFDFVYIPLNGNNGGEYIDVTGDYGLERNDNIALDVGAFSDTYNNWGNPGRPVIYERDGLIYRGDLSYYDPVTNTLRRFVDVFYGSDGHVYSSSEPLATRYLVANVTGETSRRFGRIRKLNQDTGLEEYFGFLTFVEGTEPEALSIGITDFWLDPPDPAPPGPVSIDRSMPMSIGQTGGGNWVGMGEYVQPATPGIEVKPDVIEEQNPEAPVIASKETPEKLTFPWWILILIGSTFLEN